MLTLILHLEAFKPLSGKEHIRTKYITEKKGVVRNNETKRLKGLIMLSLMS